MTDKLELRFPTISESRDWYFVEYSAPIVSNPFAIIQLTVVQDRPLEVLAGAMEAEAELWLTRYSVPVMVSAFDATGDLIYLEPVRKCDHLLAFLGEDAKTVRLYWRLLENEDLPHSQLDPDYLARVYHDLPFRTTSEIRAEAEATLGSRRIGWLLVGFWGIGVPFAFETLKIFSHNVHLIVYVYAIGKAIVEALRLTGHLPKSKWQRAHEQGELEMRHHHYHCKKNPEAFNRLKAENFDNEERERTLRTAASLKRANDPPSAPT